MKFEPRRFGSSAQRGMTLVVCLIFLLLMTLIGVSSMQNATLQERMAGSVKLRNESFQMAEAALRVGENLVAASDYPLAVCVNDALCQPPSDAGRVEVEGTGDAGFTWTKTTPADGVGVGLYTIQNIGISKDPAVINSGGVVMQSGVSYVLYRITGVGIRGSSRTVLESIYAKQ